MTIDVERARQLTPGCHGIVHLNNAGSALPTAGVLATVIDHLRRESEIGGYEAADEVVERLSAVYDSIARLLSCSPGEVAVTGGATQAWSAAFAALRFRPGDRILTGRTEYVSNVLALLQAAQRDGVVVDVVGDDEHGQISLVELDRKLDRDVALVALTHVPTSGGLVNPAAEVGRRAREAGALFFLDACQSAGQLPLDVDELGCDVLSTTGRKFLRGPRGTGFLYVRDEVADRLRPVTLDMRSATWTSPDSFEVARGARRFETWERSVANMLGLGAAVDEALGWGIPAIAERIQLLAARLRDGLAAIEGVAVHDQGIERSAIVTFTVAGMPSAEVSRQLRAGGINTAVSQVVSARLDLEHRGLPDVVRASVHYYNTGDELDRLVTRVSELAASARPAPG